MRTIIALFTFSLLAVTLLGCKPAAEKTERRQGPPEQYIRASLGAGENAKGVVGTIAIQKAIDMFKLQEGRLPASLAELKKEGFLPQIPEAPIGKKYSIDTTTGKVSIVDK